MSDPLARFARVSPSRGGDYACNVRALFSRSVKGRAAEGGRGSLTHHLALELVNRFFRRSAAEGNSLLVRTNSDQLKYIPVDGYWDEALLPSGYPRRHWRKLYVEIGRMGLRQLGRRWQSGQQLIQSQGVTYNVGNLQIGRAHV